MEISLLETSTKVLAILATGSAILGAAATIVVTLFAIRAKQRAEMQLLNHYREQLIAFRGREAESLTKEEVDRLVAVIEKSMSLMSKSDKKLLEKGLYQNSPQAVRKYIRDLTAAA